MSIYAGLDVSDKTTHVCVVDGEGAVLRREVLASDPDVIAKWLSRYYPNLVRVVLETGPLSAFLYHGMVARDVPVECICARHAKACFRRGSTRAMCMMRKVSRRWRALAGSSAST